MKGLFGDIELPPEPKRDKRGRLPTKKRGHYAAPGTGPAGKTCGTCKHIVGKQLSSKVVYKCGLARSIWTGGPGSDIRCKDAGLRAPAAAPNAQKGQGSMIAPIIETGNVVLQYGPNPRLDVFNVHPATPEELAARRCCLECLRSSLGDREPDTGLFCQLHAKFTRNGFCCDAFSPPPHFSAPIFLSKGLYETIRPFRVLRVFRG